MVKENFNIYKAGGREALDEIDYNPVEEEVAPEEKEPYDMTDKVHAHSKVTIEQVYNSYTYAWFTMLIDMAIVFIPVIKLDTFDKNKTSYDFYLLSEL